jgi:DNA-binding transcriptional ArsR family regulator
MRATIISMDIEMTSEIADERILAKIYSALGEPNRLRLVRALADKGEMTCGELAELLNVSASTASHHIAELVDCGLVAMRKQGRHHVLRLRRELIAQYAPAVILPL